MTKKKFAPKQMADGRDIEFSRELADADDLEAMARSKAADERMKSKAPIQGK